MYKLKSNIVVHAYGFISALIFTTLNKLFAIYLTL